MKKASKIFLLILIFIIVLSSVSCDIQLRDTGKGKKGLYVNKKGVIYLDSKPFYGYGINLYSTLQYHMKYLDSEEYDTIDTEMMIKDAYKADFALCAAYNIPYVRMPFSSWGTECYNYFENDRERFFRAMDDIVEEAEKCKVGIIVSLMWQQDAIPYYVSERRSSYGDPESEITKFAKEYVSAIVERYKDSPAVWGWEIGNEYNLSADLSDSIFKNYLPHTSLRLEKPSYYDYYSSEELVTFYKEIAETIRAIDPDRMITTGNGENRNFAYHAHQSSENMDEVHYWPIDWTGDTREQFIEMIGYFVPDPVDTVCFHFQHGTSGEKVGSLKFYHQIGGDVLNTGEYIKLYMEAGKKYKKGVFFGEFGDFLDMENMSKTTKEEFEAGFTQLMDWMYDDGLQIGCGWFNWSSGKYSRFNHTLVNLSEVNEYKLNELLRINTQFKEKGKQKTESYWNLYPCDGSSFLNKDKI